MTTSALRKQFPAPVDVFDAPADRARRLLRQLLAGFGGTTTEAIAKPRRPRPVRSRASRLLHDVAYHDDDGGSGDDGGWD